jgi:SAM-dependent methyltransferase
VAETRALRPGVHVPAHGLEGRARLAFRWARFGLRSILSGDLDFLGSALRAEVQLLRLTALDVIRPTEEVECNICGWTGRAFYPNTGPGYDEPDATCPGCRGIGRHRSLLALLCLETRFFEPGVRIAEVAPMRGFEALCRAQPGLDYVSFDLERSAMERGDITAMRFADQSFDYFVCFHVLEHIPDEEAALSEIHRVLHPGGEAVFQVPIDWDAEHTVEYGAPDPRDVGHVRRHGRDFGERLERAGFNVRALRSTEIVEPSIGARHGLCAEPIFFARRET